MAVYRALPAAISEHVAEVCRERENVIFVIGTAAVGAAVGAGAAVGTAVGTGVAGGAEVGAEVGTEVGTEVGALVGFAVGAEVCAVAMPRTARRIATRTPCMVTKKNKCQYYLRWH